MFQGSVGVVFYSHITTKNELSKKLTPLKINMESQNGGLEEDYPFQFSVIFRFQPLIFRGVPTVTFGNLRQHSSRSTPRREEIHTPRRTRSHHNSTHPPWEGSTSKVGEG